MKINKNEQTTKETGDREIKQVDSGFSCCCVGGSIAIALLVVAAAVGIGLGVGLSDDGSEDNDSFTSGGDLEGTGLAEAACPSDASSAVASGSFSHYVRVAFEVEGTAVSCGDAVTISTASASTYGVAAANILVTIEDPAARLRVLRSQPSPTGRDGASTSGRKTQSVVSTIIQHILATSQADASTIGARVAGALEDGSMAGALRDALPGSTFSPKGGEGADALVQGTLDGGGVASTASPVPSATPSNSPTPNTTPSNSPTPSITPSSVSYQAASYNHQGQFALRRLFQSVPLLLPKSSVSLPQLSCPHPPCPRVLPRRDQ